MKIIRFALPFLLSGFATLSFGQSYKTAGGIRIDNGIHLTVQQYIANNWTAEGILHTAIGSEDLGISLLAEKHHRVILRGTNFYTGAGVHYYSKSDATRVDNEIAHDVFGLTAIGGLEMSLGRINVAVDWKPEIHLSNEVHAFDWNGAAISVRYIFFKRERKTIKDWEVWDKFKKK